MEEQCPLCKSSETRFLTDANPHRDLHRCDDCALMWVAPETHLSLAAEKERYLQHRNSPSDEGYKRFLSRLVDPLLSILPSGSTGLDFGSGPGPTLSKILSEHGFQVANYDPLFGPYELPLKPVDFVTATEVLEHFRSPLPELRLLTSLVPRGGFLGVMTQEPPLDLKGWFYLRDPSHVTFFSDRTMIWLQKEFGLMRLFKGDGVWIFQKL